MAATKNAKAQKQKPKTFTIEELAEYWKWSVHEVRRHIRDGDLKRILVTADMPDLMDWKLYRCDENTCLRLMFPPELEEEMPMGECLLQRIWDGTPLEHFVDPVISRNIIHCLEYEYLYIPGRKAIEKAADKEHKKVRYFYDLDGNILIPICDWIPEHEGEDCISFIGIEKHIYDSPLVSFEAVEQLEDKEPPVRKRSENTIKRQQFILDFMREDPKYDFDNLVYNPSVKDIKDEVWEAFKKNYKEKGLKPDKKRKAFDNAWGAVFKVNDETGMYELR